MRRGQRRKEVVSVSLFPFLAVLVCTMGALIVLLVVIARQAKLQAAQAVVEPTAAAEPSGPGIEEQVAMIDAEVDWLEQSRSATQEQLNEAQLRLSTVEENLRRLQDEEQRLRQELDSLNQFESTTDLKADSLRAELQRLQAAITSAEQEVEKARNAALSRPRSYAIVPSRGRSGTFRRPIYVECRADRVILQPEGIVLFEADFEDPLGPGNPLAVALRATREYLATLRNGLSAEPYPLLLVRPDGIAAYYKTREAIRSWGADFGYEMIEADWRLAFPPVDRRLAAHVQRAVDNARLRQEDLRRSAPGRFGDRSRHPFSLVKDRETGRGLDDPAEDNAWSHPRGGSRSLTLGDGSGGGQWRERRDAGPEDLSPYQSLGPDRAGAAGHPAGSAYGPGGTAGGRVNRLRPNTGGADALSRDGRAATGFPNEGTVAGSAGQPSRALPQTVYPPGVPGSDGSNEPRGAEGSGGAGSGGAALDGPAGNYPPSAFPRSGLDSLSGRPTQQPGAAQGTQSFASSQPNQGTESPAGNAVGEGSSETYRTNPSPAATRSAITGTPTQQGAGSAGSTATNNANGASSGQAASSNAASSGAPPSGGSPGNGGSSPQGDMALTRVEQLPPSIAQSRGKDWGLPERPADAIPITRPIRVLCESDRLTLLTHDPTQRPQVIRLGEQTQDGIDDLVAGVWEHTRQWGMAGRGLYWRPVLRFDVRPGGEQRFRELEALLRDSGLPVQDGTVRR